MTITLALCSALVAMACSSNDPEENNMPESTAQNGEGGYKGKMLVIYFSRAGENWEVGNVERGNTAIMVDYIKEYYPNANVLESLGISGSSIRNASAKTTVENWLKRLGINKQATAVRRISTHSSNLGYAYSLAGQRHDGLRGLYIKNGKTYIK